MLPFFQEMVEEGARLNKVFKSSGLDFTFDRKGFTKFYMDGRKNSWASIFVFEKRVSVGKITYTWPGSLKFHRATPRGVSAFSKYHMYVTHLHWNNEVFNDSYYESLSEVATKLKMAGHPSRLCGVYSLILLGNKRAKELIAIHIGPVKDLPLYINDKEYGRIVEERLKT